MEKADDIKENLTLNQSKSSCHKTPEKKATIIEDKENGGVRELEREQDFLDFRSPKRLKTSESESRGTPQKGKDLSQNEIFKTPEKKISSTIRAHFDKKSPQNKESLKEEPVADLCPSSKPLNLETVEEDLISEIDQAKLLIAATKNLPRPLDKTPVKDSNSQSPRRLPTNSPGTPGRQKRVELITLASPKSKMLKPI